MIEEFELFNDRDATASDLLTSYKERDKRSMMLDSFESYDSKYWTEQCSRSQTLAMIDSFAREAGKGKKAFKKREKPRPIIEKLSLSLYFDYINSFLRAYDPSKTYTPYVSAFFDTAITKLKLTPDFSRSPSCINPVLQRYEWEVFNEIVEGLCTTVNTAKFKKIVYHHNANFKRSYLHVKEYVTKLFEIHSRLLIIRIDLHLSEEEENTYVDQDEARERLKKLLNNKRSRKLYHNSVGYIWRLEYGRKRGYHYHFFFFYDGSKSRQDGFIASKIGEHWKELTKGKGGYHNCNAKKSDYFDLCIGMVSHNDEKMRSTLLKAIYYFFKDAQTIQEKQSKKTRTWGKGEMPKPRSTLAGRPRKEAKVN